MRIVISVLFMALATASCRTAAEPDQALRLTVTATPNIQSEGQLDLSLQIRNVSEREVRTCLGTQRVFNFLGVDERNGKGTATLVDHPYCAKSVVLPAGKSLDWAERVQVPQLPTGRVKIIASVQIVSTRNCDRYGCDATNLTASWEGMVVAAERR